MYAVVFHAHQKIDRVAYKHLERLIGKSGQFPDIKQILHFEGKRGPDASKLKNNPTGGELPWHFIDPFNENDLELSKIIGRHYVQLVRALKKRDTTRSSFEAAWLAHALVDGLTPPHHYPYEEKLKTLRGGEAKVNRTTAMKRLTVKGKTRTDSIKKSFQLVGPKGLLMSHTAFEGGAYAIILPLKLNRAFPKIEDVQSFNELGLPDYFLQLAREVGAQGMFEKFYKSGWTPKLARAIRRELAPRMVMIVTLAWYSALLEAGLIEKKAK